MLSHKNGYLFKTIDMDLAASSISTYKTEIRNWILRTFNEEAKILDVGAGSGTYYELLHDKFKLIDAVEIYYPNIIDYELLKKYRSVAYANIVDLKYPNYDLIIFGDVLEHLKVEEAQKVLTYAANKCVNMIVAVPYKWSQEGNENEYERHIQDDLTHELVLERYPMLQVLYHDMIYGYYTKRICK